MNRLTVTGLKVEHRRDGFGIGTANPRLSWRVEGTVSTQAWAEIEATRRTGRSIVRLDGREQILVDWPLQPLASRERVTVRVRIGTDGGEVSGWSEPFLIEASLLDRSDWVEPLVVVSTVGSHDGPRPAHLARAEFEVGKQPAQARLYATAQGLYRAEINGGRVGDQELAPGWTSYRHRLRVQTYDVTDLLRQGSNAIGLEVADGWFRGHIGFDGGVWDLYGPHTAILAQLELTYPDGAAEVVALGEKWLTGQGPTTATALYEGETYDARRYDPRWSTPGYDVTGWSAAGRRTLNSVGARLGPAVGDPVRAIEELPPVGIERRPNGRIRLDFGQNIAGWLAIRVSGPSGQVVRLHHAEVLEGDELAIRPLRRAVSIDSYTLRGDDREYWQPRFTIHGFRYAELEGWPGGLPEPGDVAAVVVHTDMIRTGWFETSDPLLNQLHQNTVWSMRDNFVDLPTDCPQRDERMGWTGDIQVFAPAATFLYECGGVLDSWLRDVADEQALDGAVPNFVPWVPCGFPEASSAAWGDAAVIVPWTLYQRLGDKRILAQQFDSMCGWVDHLAGRADHDGAIRSGFGLGDWLDPVAPPDDPGAGSTDRHLVATAYLVRSARILAEAARVLGRDEVADHYRRQAEQSVRGFREGYVSQAGRVGTDSATSLALAIEFDLADATTRSRAGERLARLVAAGDYRVQTGFVGTPIICDALVRTGQAETAFRLLQERDCPSWLYPVTMGATTIWERWDSMLEDGRVNPGDMTSFNHYALGAVIDFMHRRIGGLVPLEPGYRSIRIEPLVEGGLTHATVRYDCPYGRIEASWRLTGSDLQLDVRIPSGVTASIRLPGAERQPVQVGAGAHRFVAVHQTNASAA